MKAVTLIVKPTSPMLMFSPLLLIPVVSQNCCYKILVSSRMSDCMPLRFALLDNLPRLWPVYILCGICHMTNS